MTPHKSLFEALAALGLSALSLALAGCGGGGGGGDVYGPDTLAGTWRVRAIGASGQASQQCPAVLRDASGRELISCGSDDRVVYGQDGSFVGDSGAFADERVQVRGTWRLDGRTLAVTLTQFGVDEDGNGVVETDELEAVNPPQVSTVHVQFNSAREVLLESEEDDTRTVIEKL